MKRTDSLRRALIRNLKYVFTPQSTAVIGASPTPGKLGNVLMKNLLEGRYVGKVYAINPKHAGTEILGKPCYPDVLAVRDRIDCAVIATPAETVPGILRQCGKRGVRGAVVISGGFSEIGRNDLEKELQDVALRYRIAVVGPNCLGVYDPYTGVDSGFNPPYKSGRPGPGDISFVTQSGAVGACTTDLAARYGVRIAKFISYGNGTVLNEADYLEYLATDGDTRSVVLYLEGAKDGRRLFEVMRRINAKKPVVALKAGRYGKAADAARSHTGNIAGSYLAYHAAFRQAKVIEAESFEELFDFIRIFNQPLPRGDRVAVVTNGGGMGVLTADALEMNGMRLPELAPPTVKAMRVLLPAYANVKNPLDLVGDAGVEVYRRAVEVLLQDKDVDCLLVVVLYQTPRIDERITETLIRASNDRRKPVAVISVGGDYTEANRRILEEHGVPTYSSPLAAVKALKRLVEYAQYRKTR